MEINPDMFYKTKDIVKHKLIRSTWGTCSTGFVWRMVQQGKLKGEQMAENTSPMLFKGSELIRFNKDNNIFVEEQKED